MFTTIKEPEKALVLHPDVFGHASSRSPELALEEIVSLTRAIDLEVVGARIFNVSKIQAGAFFGKGQREMIAEAVQEFEPDIVIVNFALSPVQQRNLEKEFKAKVIDRTGLILEIFGARAQTKEGRLQVELAALDYQRSRLVRSWTHLERQRGGAGFMGGPGERQIELDRRMLSERMTKLRKELDSVKRTRALGRKARAKVPFPVVALVGYTNAGKSTLFNRLTNSKVLAKDLLFATLDNTLRKLELPNGQMVILSDTVGFISDLPTHLIAAFRATLEETLGADILLHVCDASQEDHMQQHDDVVQILEGLDIEYDSDERIIEVYNKIDIAPDASSNEYVRRAKFEDDVAAISAVSGEGLDDLFEKIMAKLSQTHVQTRYSIPHSYGQALSWLYEHGEITEREDQDKAVVISMTISPENVAIFEDRFGVKPL
jgi:GTP-binding protein HflX